jgi:hypothetical protein
MVRPAHVIAVALAAARLGGSPAVADPVDDTQPVKRTPDATLRRLFRGPFQSSRLFAMPTADTVGAYMMSLSGDGSLLQQTGILTSAGVLAIGFGDIAQLEYRHSAAISVTGVNAPLPGVGVQIKVPIPDHPNIPALGVAFRLGVPRDEQFGGTQVRETVTDLYLVGRLRFEPIKWLTLHGGTRISSAKITLLGDHAHDDVQKTLWLPTAGYEIAMNPTAKIVGEIALAPQFHWMQGTDADPTIGYGLLGRLGLRWSVLPSLVIDGSIGYQLEVANAAQASGLNAVVQWDIRLGAEVFVPWGALACRAVGAFCE